MWVGVISLLPEILGAGLSGGVVSRAVDGGIITLETFNPRDFTEDRHRTVDDRSYGGGAGMVMMTQPLSLALEAAKKVAPEGSPVVFLSPHGQLFSQQMAVEGSRQEGIILICGRYEGIDERFVQAHVDEVWSIGDYVLSGGELPSLVVIDAIARHLPGTLGNSLSIIDESHLDGTLDYPHYTRPVETDYGTVPSVLLSGDHAQIADYRRREALQRTLNLRPDLLVHRVFDERDRKLLKTCFAQPQQHES